MKIALFGATGAVGGECLVQALEAGHELTVVARTPSKLPSQLRDAVRIVEGNALEEAVVREALGGGTEAVLFAIGVDSASPEDLCTDVTRHILKAMPQLGVRRLVWCGGGSTLVEGDQVTFGARFVEFFARTFMGLRHRDKAHQWALLNEHLDLEWVGVRPLQIRKGPKRADYRLGFDTFSGFSTISFADCADAMLDMLHDDTWIHKAPILQY
jgi:putative NADH-flavin reductase